MLPLGYLVLRLNGPFGGGGGGWELKEAKPVANSPGLPSLGLSSLLRRVCVGTAGP